MIYEICIENILFYPKKFNFRKCFASSLHIKIDLDKKYNIFYKIISNDKIVERFPVSQQPQRQKNWRNRRVAAGKQYRTPEDWEFHSQVQGGQYLVTALISCSQVEACHPWKQPTRKNA